LTTTTLIHLAELVLHIEVKICFYTESDDKQSQWSLVELKWAYPKAIPVYLLPTIDLCLSHKTELVAELAAQLQYNGTKEQIPSNCHPYQSCQSMSLSLNHHLPPDTIIVVLTPTQALPHIACSHTTWFMLQDKPCRLERAADCPSAIRPGPTMVTYKSSSS
jgi:hypothetical protein